MTGLCWLPPDVRWLRLDHIPRREARVMSGLQCDPWIFPRLTEEATCRKQASLARHSLWEFRIIYCVRGPLIWSTVSVVSQATEA